MVLKQLTESIATSLVNHDRLPQLKIRQVINRKAPIKFSMILVTKQIVFLLGWVRARVKSDVRTWRMCILSFKGRSMFTLKASHTVTLKTMLRGDHSLSSGLLLWERYLSTKRHINIGSGWLGAERFLSSYPAELLQRTGWMLWVTAGATVSSLDQKMQVCGAQCALKPALYHRVHTACVTKGILLSKRAALFGIFFSKCSSSKMGEEKKRQQGPINQPSISVATSTCIFYWKSLLYSHFLKV